MKAGHTIALSLLALTASLAACTQKESPRVEQQAPLPKGAVRVTADDNGFTPSAVTFKKGEPATLVFVRTTNDTCATEVVFPDLDLKKDLPMGTPVTIEIPTDKEQKLTFQCGMGMYKSSVVINGGS